jgi:hypothetical protein
VQATYEGIQHFSQGMLIVELDKLIDDQTAQVFDIVV